MFIKRKFIGFLKRYGSGFIKARIWNNEFAEGKWDYLDPDEGSPIDQEDPLVSTIEQYGQNGHILDLGCGTGKLGQRIDIEKYAEYKGVDVSSVAIQVAQQKCSADRERTRKNSYQVADMLDYADTKQYDVIVFQEVLYYFNKRDVQAILSKFAHNFAEGGAFIMKVHDRQKHNWLIQLVEREHRILDVQLSSADSSAIYVFRPKDG